MSSNLTEEEITFDEKDPKPVLHYLVCLKKLFNEVAPNATEEQNKQLATMSTNILKCGIDSIKKIESSAQKKIQQFESDTQVYKDQFAEVQKFSTEKIDKETLKEALTEHVAKKNELMSDINKYQEKKDNLMEKIKTLNEEHHEKKHLLMQKHKEIKNQQLSETADFQLQRMANFDYV